MYEENCNVVGEQEIWKKGHMTGIACIERSTMFAFRIPLTSFKFVQLFHNCFVICELQIALLFDFSSYHQGADTEQCNVEQKSPGILLDITTVSKPLPAPPRRHKSFVGV